MAINFKQKKKDLLRQAFLGSIKFYDASKRMPKLLPVDHSERRYQEMSRPCLVYWKWNNQKNGTKPNLSFATLFKTGWVVSGATGSLDVISWAYIPKDDLIP